MKRLVLITITIAVLAVFSTRHAPAIDQLNLPGTFDVIMFAGADWQLYLQFRDTTGKAMDVRKSGFASQFRAAPGGTLFATYSTLPMVNYSGIRVSLSRAQTAALSGKTGVWDLVQHNYSTNIVSYRLTGKAVVRPTVTRLP